MTYLNVKGLMDKSQHGSRSGRSTLSQLLLHHDKLLEALKNGDNIDAIYLNFAKVFDQVDHILLMRKLKQMGLKGRLGMWIQNFLKNRTQQVLIEGKLSSSFTLISGIPQGSVLGPILFLIFISDITEGLSSDVFIYVDDTKASRGSGMLKMSLSSRKISSKFTIAQLHSGCTPRLGLVQV